MFEGLPAVAAVMKGLARRRAELAADLRVGRIAVGTLDCALLRRRNAGGFEFLFGFVT